MEVRTHQRGLTTMRGWAPLELVGILGGEIPRHAAERSAAASPALPLRGRRRKGRSSREKIERNFPMQINDKLATRQKLPDGLAQQIGSASVFPHPTGRLVYTEGVQFLAD